MTQSESAAYDRFSQYYDLMVADRRSHIDFYSGLIESGQVSLADICCGTGAITAILAQRLCELSSGKIHVVGVDGSTGMLDQAARHHAGIEWIRCDLRDIRVKGEFELVTSMYNSLQHVDLAGLELAFDAMRRITVRGGRLAFDIYKPNLAYIRIPQANRLARTVWNEQGERLEIRENTSFEENMMCLSLDWRLVNPERPDDLPLAETSLRLWQHQPQDVERLLRKSGFQIIARYGDLDRQPYGEAAKKQVIVCRAI